MSFSTSVTLLVFCLDDPFIDVSRVLKSPTRVVLLPVFPFMLISNSFCIFRGSYMGLYINECNILFLC